MTPAPQQPDADAVDLDELDRLAKAARLPYMAKNRGLLCSTPDGKGQNYFAVQVATELREYIVAACNATPLLIQRIRELEKIVAECGVEYNKRVPADTGTLNTRTLLGGPHV